MKTENEETPDEFLEKIKSGEYKLEFNDNHMMKVNGELLYLCPLCKLRKKCPNELAAGKGVFICQWFKQKRGG